MPERSRLRRVNAYRVACAVQVSLAMNLQPTITFHGMDPSPAIEAAVRERTEKLERLSGRIISCRVTITAPSRHRHKGNLYAAHVDVALPGAEIVASANGSGHADADVYVALRNAFAAITRQLEETAQKRRGDVKSHAGRTSARVPVPDHGGPT